MKRKEIVINEIDDLYFTNLDDIDHLLTGPYSYEDKVKVLQEEKEKLESLLKYVKASEYMFTKQDDYILRMKEIYDDVKKDIKKDGVCIFITGSATSYTYNLYNSLLSQGIIGTPKNYILLTLCGLSGISFLYFFLTECNNLVDYDSYKAALKDHEKTLKKD